MKEQIVDSALAAFQTESESILETAKVIDRADFLRAAELLRGAPPENPDEIPLSEQVRQYRRLLESTIEMDRRLSIRIGGERSFYKKFR